MVITEVRKEDDTYFQGAFWIIANSIVDMLHSNFTLECNKVLSDFNGKILENVSKNSLTHKNVWKNKLQTKYPGKDYNYYPRGRVAIYNGQAFIHINSICNTPAIIDKITEEYGLSKLEINIECNDIIQGSHYDFSLR